MYIIQCLMMQIRGRRNLTRISGQHAKASRVRKREDGDTGFQLRKCSQRAKNLWYTSGRRPDNKMECYKTPLASMHSHLAAANAKLERVHRQSRQDLVDSKERHRATLLATSHRGSRNPDVRSMRGLNLYKII